VAINKIRNRVLLDVARNKLAVICGYDNWKAWKASSDSRDEMLNSAFTRLSALSNDVSPEWLALGKQRTALQLLLLPSRIRNRGDIAAHVSAKKLIGESILALTEVQERNDMIVIYKAVYGEEP